MQNKINNQHQEKKSVGQLYLSNEFEECLLKTIDKLSDWEVPLDKFGFGIRRLVKSYLDSKEIIQKRFRENMPGVDWLQSFIKRHRLTKRCADNVEASRAEVNHEIMNIYFDNLQTWLEGIAPDNIFNYDETNVTGDPGSETVIVRGGKNRVERKTYHSKSSTNVMFSRNATGNFLPPMYKSVYKSEFVYQYWTRDGPNGTVYDAIKRGWFDNRTFTTWFFKVLLNFIYGKEGPFALIRDNHGSHFSTTVIEECCSRNIIFICLPPNPIHLCQPLDVAVFPPAKIEWKDVLDTWRRE